MGMTVDFGIDGFEGDVLRKMFESGVGYGRRLQGLAGLGLSLELAVDTDVGILVETGIGFEARFGLCVAFNDVEIMMEDTESPFEGFGCMSVFESVGLSLGFFDKFAVSHAGCGPFFREMVGVEFE